MAAPFTVICEGCPYYEREVARRDEDAPAGPSNVTEYQHKCWHDPAPVTRRPWTREAIVRACAHKPNGRKRKGGATS